MKYYSIATSVFLSLSLLSNISYGQNSSGNSATNSRGVHRKLVIKKTRTVVRSKVKPKKKTINELLQDIDTRGRNMQIKKQAVAIPEAQKIVTSSAPLYEVKPPKSNDIFRETGTDEEKLEAITDESIAQLYKLTQQYSKSPRRGELWLRLAETYVEKSKYIEYRLQKIFDDKLQAFYAKKAPKPRLDLTASREYNLKAIKLYEWFLRDFPKDPKIDQALFFLGYNHVEMDQVKQGIVYYQRLTKEFPNSLYVSEARFALGEYYFDNEKWLDAQKAYTDVLKNKRARLYTFALYKIAWCQFRMGHPGSGLKTLEAVIKRSRSPSEMSGNLEGRRAVSRIKLGGEALKDVVLFYADVGTPQGAANYFLSIGGEKAEYPMLEKLAYLYSDSGRKEDARLIFKSLVEHAPTAPKAFDYQYQIVLNYSTIKNQKSYRDELYTWIDSYGPESEWARANSANQKLIQDAFALRESSLRNYTLMLHKNAQNSQKRPHLNSVKQAYSLYLEKFPDSAKAAEMHFFYGELLYSLNEFPLAANEYSTSANKDPKGKYYQVAVLNNLLALEKMLKTDEQIKQVVGESIQPVALGETENAFILAAEKYLTTFPKGEKVVEVRFKIGRLLYSFNHFDEALKMFKEIVMNHPKTPYAVYSANLILDIYNLRKDYGGLAREGTLLMNNRSLIEQGFQTDIKDLVEKAGFKKAEDLETSKDYEGSGKAYSEFVKDHPRSTLAGAAAFNAGINYERAHKIPEAIAYYAKVSGNNSKENEKLRQKSMLLLGRLYEQTAQYDKAAIQFEKYAKENPKDKSTPDLYYNSAVIWEGQKEFYKALADYQKYFDISRRRDRSLALFSMAKIHEKMGHFKLAQEGYDQYLHTGATDPEKIVEANFKIGELNTKRGHLPEAEKAWRKTVYVQRTLAQEGKSAGLVFAAEAKFKLTEDIYNEFTAVRIPSNPKKQAQAIREKLALLTKLSTGLAEVIKYDEGGMVIASLTKLGQAYEHIAKGILKAPLPRDLNSSELEAYKKGILSVAQPLEAKSIENYSSAIRKSYEINYYNNWTKISLDALVKFQPDKYREPLEVLSPMLKADDRVLND
jgi:TolA-binding protein